MTRNAPKVTMTDLKRIINEEMSVLSEKVDHSSIKTIVTNASELLEAIESFKEKAGPTAVSAITPGINQLEQILEDMLSTPGSYVQKSKRLPQKISFKPTKA